MRYLYAYRDTASYAFPQFRMASEVLLGVWRRDTYT
jgi:hypothetical protein